MEALEIEGCAVGKAFNPPFFTLPTVHCNSADNSVSLLRTTSIALRSTRRPSTGAAVKRELFGHPVGLYVLVSTEARGSDSRARARSPSAASTAFPQTLNACIAAISLLRARRTPVPMHVTQRQTCPLNHRFTPSFHSRASAYPFISVRIRVSVQVWERFSYYGMRALLILYLTKVILSRELWRVRTTAKLA